MLLWKKQKKTLKKSVGEIKSRWIASKTNSNRFWLCRYGNVSKGAQEIFEYMPTKVIPADMLSRLHDSLTLDTSNLYKVVFKEEDIVQRKDKQPF